MNKTSQISDQTINRIATIGKFCAIGLTVTMVLRALCDIALQLLG